MGVRRGECARQTHQEQSQDSSVAGRGGSGDAGYRWRRPASSWFKRAALAAVDDRL